MFPYYIQHTSWLTMNLLLYLPSTAVYGWMMDRMPRFRARQTAGALFAVGKLNLYNAELVGALLEVSNQQQSCKDAYIVHHTPLRVHSVVGKHPGSCPVTLLDSFALLMHSCTCAVCTTILQDGMLYQLDHLPGCVLGLNLPAAVCWNPVRVLLHACFCIGLGLFLCPSSLNLRSCADCTYVQCRELNSTWQTLVLQSMCACLMAWRA